MHPGDIFGIEQDPERGDFVSKIFVAGQQPSNLCVRGSHRRFGFEIPTLQTPLERAVADFIDELDRRRLAPLFAEVRFGRRVLDVPEGEDRRMIRLFNHVARQDTIMPASPERQKVVPFVHGLVGGVYGIILRGADRKLLF